MLSIDEIRKNIILKDGLYYFDYTASGLAYKPIEKEILSILKTYANTHSEHASNAILTQHRYENAREELKALLGLDDSFYLIATGTGATGAIKKFQEILGIYMPPMLKKRLGVVKDDKVPLVIVSPYEHHSVEISFKEGFCDVERIPLTSKGEINLGRLDQILKLNSNREIIGCFSAASNVTGVISDYQKIYTMIKKYNGIVAFDMATLAAYANIDCNFFDAVFISAHKLLGGVGSCGLLAIKKELCDTERPTFAAGGTVSYVSRTSYSFIKKIELMEEGGTPGIIQLIRANLAFRLRNLVGLDEIKKRENELLEMFCNELDKIKEIINYCPKNIPRLPIFAFNAKGISPYEFAKTLSDDFGIQTRAGCACAGPYGHDLLGLEDNQNFEHKPGWVRASLHYTHSDEDIAYLINAIKKSIKKHKKFINNEKK
ncbi:MAG: aminotransferase class V-fold PLP-dependent enzyme [Campylobacter sp.]